MEKLVYPHKTSWVKEKKGGIIMKSKTKWIAALTSLCVVLLIAVVSLGIVWAATTQSVSSSVKVTYTVTDVVADVSASRYLTSANTKTDFTGGTNGVVTFNAPDVSTTETLSITDTTLTSTNNLVVYEYVIKNKGANTITASLATGTATNLTIYTIAPTTTQKTNVISSFDATEWTASNAIAATTIASGATTYAYVAMKIADTADDASFNGTFVWTLTGQTT